VVHCWTQKYDQGVAYTKIIPYTAMMNFTK